MSVVDPPLDRDDLCRRIASGWVPQFLFFWGHTDQGDSRVGPFVLSQWWPASFSVDGVRYRSAEQFMMAEKARMFADDAMLAKILAAATPNEAKALGRKVRNFEESRWERAAFAIVVRGNLAKFGQNPALGAYLLSTGEGVLVEASPLDAIWGIGHAAADPAAADPVQWLGKNLLGFALMSVRQRLGEKT